MITPNWLFRTEIEMLVLWSQSIKIDVINWLISLFINIFMLSFHEMNDVYYLNAHSQYEWYDGSWDEPESISILDAIHVYGWDPHTEDMYNKSYTWISSTSHLHHLCALIFKKSKMKFLRHMYLTYIFAFIMHKS